MLQTSSSTTALAPSSPSDVVALIGRRDHPHLRIVSVNSLESYVIVAVHAGNLLHSSCYLRPDNRGGYRVQHTVRHPTDAPILDVRAIVRRLLPAKRFYALLGIRGSTGPVDVLRCGVAVGNCTFFIREFADGDFVAVFDDGDRQTQFAASADDWNAIVDAWEAEGASFGDVRRVRIAERFFRSRGWLPQGEHVVGNDARREH